MKRLQVIFFALATLLAPVIVRAESNKPITITIPANVPHFHPVFDGASLNIRFFVQQTTTSGISFNVHPGDLYEVHDTVNGVDVLVSHVFWDADGVAHTAP
jgi:hypothetical protein